MSGNVIWGVISVGVLILMGMGLAGESANKRTRLKYVLGTFGVLVIFGIFIIYTPETLKTVILFVGITGLVGWASWNIQSKDKSKDKSNKKRLLRSIVWGVLASGLLYLISLDACAVYPPIYILL